jgi:hypothetical protein
MVAHGARTAINHASGSGNTALHLIARNFTQIEAVRALLRHGADVNALNSKGNTPLREAASGMLRLDSARNMKRPTATDNIRAQDEMMLALQGAGGCIDQMNEEGKTPRQLLEETRAKWREESR